MITPKEKGTGIRMKFFKKSDIMIIFLILVLSIMFTIGYKYINSDKSAVAEIYYNSQLVKTVELDTGVDQTFRIPQNEHVLIHLDKDGTIRFEESDCPDQVCVRAGKIGMVGESAACLPNKIIIKIIPKDGYDDDAADMIVG